ncbi:MAG: thiamine phosphate synthase [Nitrospirales bacterium]
MVRPSSRLPTSLHGLYIILDPAAFPGRDLVVVLSAAAEAGARLFQYRDKTASMKDAYQQAVRLRQASADAGALFIVNDRCDLALSVDADGVHLGQQDMPLTHARRLMGPEKLIGVSTHRVEDVDQATTGGADYLGFGPIFDTGTKPDHEPVVGIEGLRQARARTRLPIIAIGGLTVANSRGVVEAGADGIAVVSTVAKASDVRATVRDLLAHFA